jgi:phage terminase large subunit-like protein
MTGSDLIRSNLGKCFAMAATVTAIAFIGPVNPRAQQADPPATAGKLINSGDVLSGQLNAMRSRAKGKRGSIYQLVSEPRRLPPPNGLCGLETGPETFQIVTSNDAQAAQLKRFIGKEFSVRVDEMACAQDAGQMSEAVIIKWSVVTTH